MESRRSLCKRGFSGFALLCIAGLSMIGCGGGGNGSSTPSATPTPIPTPTPVPTRNVRPSLTINWGARSRDVSAPASALSAVVSVSGYNGSSTTFTANRPDGTTPVSQNYTADTDIKVSDSVTTAVVFYANSGGSGALVATGSTSGSIPDTGVLPTFTNIQKSIAAVVVTPGQSINVGEQKFLGYTAKRSTGEVVAVVAGSAFFTVAAGGDKLSANGEVGQGIAGGIASVTATVDGVVSAPVDVTVIAPVKIALVANGQGAQTVALLDTLRTRNVTPMRFDAVPDPNTLQQFDVLMILAADNGHGVIERGNIGVADAAKVEAFLKAGKGVVLLGLAPAFLANTSVSVTATTSDLSSISSWFGGATRIIRDAGAYYDTFARSTPGVYALPDNIQPGGLIYTDVNYDSHPYIRSSDIQNPTVDRVLEGNGTRDTHAIAYEEPYGGRVYWQFHPYGLNAAYSNKVVSLLLAGTNWTAKR